MASFIWFSTVFFVSAQLYGSSVGANCLFVYRFDFAVSLPLAFSSLVGKVRCVRAGNGVLQPLSVQQVVQNGNLKSIFVNNCKSYNKQLYQLSPLAPRTHKSVAFVRR